MPLPPQIWTFSSLYSPILLYFCPLACFSMWIIVHAHLYMFLVYSSIRRPCRQKNYVLCFVIVFVKILSAIYLASTTFLLALTTFLWYIHAPWKLSIPNRKNEYTDEKNSLYSFFLFSIPNKFIQYTQFWKSLCPFRKISLSNSFFLFVRFGKSLCLIFPTQACVGKNVGLQKTTLSPLLRGVIAPVINIYSRGYIPFLKL